MKGVIKEEKTRFRKLCESNSFGHKDIGELLYMEKQLLFIKVLHPRAISC